MAQVATITKQTAISIGLAVSLMTGTWYAAGRCSEIDMHAETIKQNTADIRQLQADMQYLRRGMVRIEAKLGTLPADEADRRNP